MSGNVCQWCNLIFKAFCCLLIFNISKKHELPVTSLFSNSFTQKFTFTLLTNVPWKCRMKFINLIVKKNLYKKRIKKVFRRLNENIKSIAVHVTFLLFYWFKVEFSRCIKKEKKDSIKNEKVAVGRESLLIVIESKKSVFFNK